jgi:hypothetical protein
MENSKIDASGSEVIKKQQEQRQEQREKYILSAIEVIQRQTDYDSETAKQKLEEWDYNYLNVIKEYMNPNFQEKKTDKPNATTKNQMIYGEIRNFMDGVNKEQIWRKHKAEYIEKRKLAYIAHMIKLQEEERKKVDIKTVEDDKQK